MSTVVVSTHLDDAVLSCYRELGPETIVVTVCAGIPPPGTPGSWDRRTGSTDSTARMRERRAEDIEALALSGSRAVHLDLLDSQYAELPPAAEIAAALAPILEASDRVLGPAGILNVDHKAVRDAVLLARPDAVLYADLPYALHPDHGGFALPEELVRPQRRAGRGTAHRAGADGEAGGGQLLPDAARPARRRVRRLPLPRRAGP